ncbi:MAG: hypothetical protein ACP5G1_04490, partial [Nanopusillaceae archaeon]
MDLSLALSYFKDIIGIIALIFSVIFGIMRIQKTLQDSVLVFKYPWSLYLTEKTKDEVYNKLYIEPPKYVGFLILSMIMFISNLVYFILEDMFSKYLITPYSTIMISFFYAITPIFGYTLYYGEPLMGLIKSRKSIKVIVPILISIIMIILMIYFLQFNFVLSALLLGLGFFFVFNIFIILESIKHKISRYIIILNLLLVTIVFLFLLIITIGIISKGVIY